jgi:predicted MFS family arabinose efflux permease
MRRGQIGYHPAMQKPSWRTPLVVLICGSAILLICFGVRQNYGILMGPISTSLHWGREVFGFAIAVQNLVWGLTTPVAGFIADRYGPGRVAAIGSTLYASGLILMSYASTPLDATISIGVLTGFAGSMAGFPVILSVIGRSVGPERRSLWLGIASAAGSSGQVVLVPIGNQLIQTYGWEIAILGLAALAALTVPLAAVLVGGNKAAPDQKAHQSPREAFVEASRHSGFRLLSIGYFVCGFQTMFITAHLPAFLTDRGFSSWLGVLALMCIGGANIIGCIVWGELGNRFPKKNMLCVLYAMRSVVLTVFMLTPISETSVIVFASVMGLMWLGTVPLTSGLVAQIFGTQFMATLVGFTFISHQVGSFLGTWLAGVLYDHFGNYDAMFWAAIVVGFLASFVHYPIDDKPVARLQPQPARG